MKIVILMEDTEPCGGLECEHGFSVCIETANTKFIADTGASDKTWDNARKLGIDLSSVGRVFLSHGHYDHSGGIMSFAEMNPCAKIYMHPEAAEDYYSITDGKEKYIGIDKAICSLAAVNHISEEYKADDAVSVFNGVTGRRKWPASNLRLRQRTGSEYVQDSFRHEMYVVVNENGKLVLISGCAHNGILNILDRFMEIYGRYPHTVISGFHMMKNGQYDSSEIKLIKDIAEELKQTGTMFYTGHCTGMAAYEIMKPIMGDKIEYVHAGMTVTV